MSRTSRRLGVATLLALIMTVLAQAQATARYQSLADGALNVERACVDGVRFQAGSGFFAPEEIKNQPKVPPPGLETATINVQAAVTPPAPLVLNEPALTLEWSPRVVKFVDNDGNTFKQGIQYYGRFTLAWSTPLQPGQTVTFSLQAFEPDTPTLTVQVEDCRLFKAR
jgi:type II secretory pathway pseudopilin PulG